MLVPAPSYMTMGRVWQKDYANHSEAMVDVDDYIVGFYNCTRLHSTLGIFHPTLLSINRRLHILLRCPK